MTRLDVLLPVYNEQVALPGFLDSLVRVLESQPLDWLIHIVVDRSTDDTEAVVRSFSSSEPRIRALFLSARFGHQESLFAGLCATRRDAYVLMMDADGQHPPELIAELLRAAQDGAEIVQTRRLSTVGQGVVARQLSAGFYRVLSWLAGIPLHPGMADFRLLAPVVVDVLRDAIWEQRPFLRGLMAWIGFRQRVVDYHAIARIGGTTKYTLHRRLQFARNAIIAFSHVPLRLAAPVGLTIALVCMVYGLGTLVVAFADRSSLPPGWVSIFVFGLFIGAIQLAFIGILGEYLANVYLEVQRRPRFVVRDALNYGNDEYRRTG